MKFAMMMCVFIPLIGCASTTKSAGAAYFRNDVGDVISVTRSAAVIRGQSYVGSDCSNESMYCIDYAGYFSIIAPKKCRDIRGRLWKVGDLIATNLGVDHHQSRTMYGVNRGEMVAYIYAWDGAGIVGLAFDAKHKVGNYDALESMGYRASSIFYEKTAGVEFLACTK